VSEHHVAPRQERGGLRRRGALGGAIARSFAREGAAVFLAGRSLPALDRVAEDINAAGGAASTAQVDALDEQDVDRHLDRVREGVESIDVAVNAVGIFHVQGVPLAELSLEDFEHPIAAYARTNFLTARAAARHMVPQGSGVVLTISTVGSRMAVPGSLGYAAACAAIESFSRTLSGELGPSGIRVVCLRSDVIPEALDTSHVRRVFERIAVRAGTTVDAMVSDRARSGTLLGRFPTLAQVADYAAFAASDRAGALTGAIANLSSGSLVD
jgi:3-oxoacyl-[acyl-carrier protein] reductase